MRWASNNSMQRTALRAAADAKTLAGQAAVTHKDAKGAVVVTNAAFVMIGK